MLRYYRRPLLDSERDDLAAELAQHLEHQRNFRRFIAVTAALVLIVGVPLAYTQVGDDRDLIFLAAGVLAAYIGILAWVYRENAGESAGRASSLASALNRNEARVLHCQANEMLAFAEYEDEGPALLFQVDADSLLFLSGQLYYPTRRFPSTDFQLIEILDGSGVPASFRIESRGEKLKPSRTVSREQKLRMVDQDLLPEDLTLMDGQLQDVEQRLMDGSARLTPLTETD